MSKKYIADNIEVSTSLTLGGNNVLTTASGYATELYVNGAISGLIDSAPATLDTLNELAAALGDDPNFATTVSNSIGLKWTQDNVKISNWDTAFSWGNHAGLYLPIGHDMTLTLGGDLSGAVTFTNMGNATLTATIVANSVALGTDTTGNYMINVTAGGGISVSHTQGEGSTATVSHADTSTAADLTASSRTYVSGLTFDTYGHVTGYTTGTETVVDTNTTYTAGGGLSLAGTVFSHSDTSTATNLTASGRTYVTGLTFDTYGHVTGYTTGTETVVDTNTTYSAGGGLSLAGTVFSHLDTSAQASVNNSGRTYIQDITLDTYGHVTGIVSATDSDSFTGTVTSVTGTGSYGGLTLSGSVTTSGSLTFGGTPSGTWPISVSGDAGGFSTSLYYTDNRTISPSELSANRMSFGFTSFNNNNTAPWADFIHMRSYQDSSGGSDNLLVFSKSSLAARLYQQTYGSATAYSSYVDFITSGNIGSQSVSSAATLTTARTINGTSFNGSANITTASWGTSRTISLTGAVTGSVSVDGSANVSIATTHTADPVLTLTGDATGSATFTNLGNATLTVTVVDDSHTHDGRYYTESESDGRYIIRNSGFEWTGTGASALSFRSLDTIDTASGDQAALEVYQDTVGADAFMQFHINGDYAKYFGLHGGINDFVIGGWSHGASYQRIFHDGYRPNADKWTTARTISLTGAVTGSTSIDGSGNVSIATTHTADPVLTLAGDATGSATFTNLGSATLTVAVVDDSHTHDGRYFTEAESDARFAPISHTHSYLPLSGGTISGNLTVTGTIFNGAYTTAQNGYTKLPNGIIIQWGRYTQTGSSATYNFPLVFPGACLGLWATKGRTSTAATSQTTAAGVGLLSTAQFYLDSNDAGGTGYVTFIFAIGY